MFDNVAAEGLSIADIKPSAGEGEGLGSGAFDLQTLDAFGGMVEQFVYLTEEDGVEADGWYNDDWETPAVKVFARGEGFMFNSAYEDAAITIAGQVMLGQVEQPLAQYYQLKGNFRPVDMPISDITPVAEGESVGSGAFDLQTLDAFGGMVEQFVYLTEDDGVEADGWYNDDWETPANRVFVPGEGFMFNSAYDGAKLVFKAVAY